MKERLSNFEVLRIICMLMVLTLHVLAPLKWPYDTSLSLLQHIGFNLTYMLSIVAVNTFVLISGWFGINTTRMRLIQIAFHTFFWVVVITLTTLIARSEYNSLQLWLQGLLLADDSLLFIKCYFGLMIMTPILNSFVEHASQKLFRRSVVMLLCFVATFGWIFNNSYSSIVTPGFSVISFVTLYLLGRYLRLYPQEWESIANKKKTLLLLYAIPLVILALVTSFIYKLWDIHSIGFISLYSNPLIICSSVALLLFFAKFKFKSKSINLISANVLAVYIIHMHPFVINVYSEYSLYIYQQSSGFFSVLALIAYILIVFLTCIMVDFIRAIIWKYLERKVIRT